jgi:uncharacterized protein YqhQ
MLVAIVTFSFTPTKGAFWIKLLIRTPLIPVIAGISYEILRLTAKLRSKGLFKFLSSPGMLLQRLTARHPDEKQLQVSVIAMTRVIDLERNLKGESVPDEQQQLLIPAET